MSSADFLAGLVQGFVDALQPLDEMLSTPDGLSVLLAQTGWSLDQDADLTTIEATVGPVSQAVSALVNSAQAIAALPPGSDDQTVLTILKDVIADIPPVINAVNALATAAADPDWPTPFDDAAFWASFAEELLDLLVFLYLKRHLPVLFGMLRFAGMLTEDMVSAPAEVGRQPYWKRSVQWSLFPALVGKPGSLFPTVYGWGQGAGTFDHTRFISGAQALVEGLGLAAAQYSVPGDLAQPYYDPSSTYLGDVHQLHVPVYGVALDFGGGFGQAEVALVLLPIPDGATTDPPGGFALFPIVNAHDSVSFQLTSNAKLTMAGGFEADPIRLEARPSGFQVKTSLTGEIQASATLEVTPEDPSAPWVILGPKNSTRLELKSAAAGLTAQGPVNDLEYIVEAGFDGLAVVIDFGEGDGFLQKMVGGNPQRLDFSTALSWSNKNGFGLRGQAQLEANLAVHLSIAGVLSVDTIYIAVRAGTSSQTGTASARLIAAASGGLDIGPVAATVDQIGLQLDLVPIPKGQPPGNLGALDLQFHFKPPTGLGLVVDAGAVVGGGYIFFDSDKGQYAGVLELALESIQIKAIGILTTRMPDGSSGFSFLIIVTTEFTPIQLGFGFTLNGVGGLAGINRTMILDALRAGLKAHALNSILFPVDPVKNATKIITDVTSIFPPADGRYVFGPMIEIGWGSPTLVTGELGIVIEFPSPVRLAILGQVKAAIPTEDEAIVLLHIDVLGTVDFGLKKLAIDASIYDSRLAAFDLLGDMALRLNWGDDALFILSLGGLHPQFQPPPEFPKLARLTVSLGDGDNPRLALQAYMAVTSNTLQFGAQLEFYADAGSFSVHGYLGFDALFIFSPFHFVVEMRAGVQIAFEGATLLGIDLDLKLSGPTPWAYDGTASISFLFFSISVHIAGTFGGGTAPELPAAPVMTPLLAALGDRHSWSSQLPPDTMRAVTLMSPKPDDTSLYVHPRGTLTVVQSVVPLNTLISKFGSASPSDGDFFAIAKVTLAGTQETPASVAGQFAPAQYNEMSDADKLADRSFVPLPAGVAIGAADIETGSESNLDLEYDVQIIDDLLLPARGGPKYQMTAPVMAAVAGQSAAALSLVRCTGNSKFIKAGTTSSISNRDTSSVVAGTADLRVNYAISPGAGASDYQARAALAAHLQAHPEDEGRYQVIFAHEVVA